MPIPYINIISLKFDICRVHKLIEYLTVPTHIEVTAILLFCRRNSERAVTTWRAPVQPRGWPKALLIVSIMRLGFGDSRLTWHRHGG